MTCMVYLESEEANCMAKTIDNKQELADRFPRSVYLNPATPRFAIEYTALQEELRQLRQRVAELEEEALVDEVIMLKDITKEQAKQEIQKIFSSGRTLYYSDIVKELRIDLETVVDICNELQKNKEIEIDVNAS